MVRVLSQVVKSPWFGHGWPRSEDDGWGNGYVFVDIGHPWYGLDKDQLSKILKGKFPKAITFSEESGSMWQLGFDTLGSCQCETKEEVLQLTYLLRFIAINECECNVTLN